MVHLDEYREVVRAKICAKCVDGDANGGCRIGGEQACAIIDHLPRIVETVLSVESDRLEPYVKALRENVCAGCQHQETSGNCAVREKVDCPLDRYFPMIVDVLLEQRFQLNQMVLVQ